MACRLLFALSRLFKGLLLVLLLVLLLLSSPGNATPTTGTIGEWTTDTINQGLMLTIAYNITDHVSMPFRLSTTALQANLSHPVFVSVRQGRHITSWNIPYIQDSHGFLHVERTLCPILNSPYSTNTSTTSSFIYVDVSTPTSFYQNITILLDFADQYELSMNSSVDVTVSAPSPVFYVYEFPDDNTVNEVLVSVTSDSNVCALVSVQDGLCPNDLLVEYPSHRGVYQTMERLSAFTYQRSVHQNFFYVVVTILHDEWCLQTSRDLIDGLVQLNTSDQYNPVSIHAGELYTDPKNISISIKPTLPVSKYWIGPLVSFLIYFIFYLIVLGWIIIDWRYFHKQEPFKVFEEMNSTDCLNEDTDVGPPSAEKEEGLCNGGSGWKKGILKRPNFISVLKGNNWSSEATRITHTASPKDHEYINQQFTNALVKVYPCPTPSPPAQQTRPPRPTFSHYRSWDNQPLLKDSPDHVSREAIKRQLSYPAQTVNTTSTPKFWNAQSKHISKASDVIVPSPPPLLSLSPSRRRLGVSECHEYRRTTTNSRDHLNHARSYDAGLNSSLEPESGYVMANPHSRACLNDQSRSTLSYSTVGFNDEDRSINNEVIIRVDSHAHGTETHSNAHDTEIHYHKHETETHSHATTPETQSQAINLETHSSTSESQSHTSETQSHTPETRSHAPKTQSHTPETHSHSSETRSYAPETQSNALETTLRTRSNVSETQSHFDPPQIQLVPVSSSEDNFFTFPGDYELPGDNTGHTHNHTPPSSTSSANSSPTYPAPSHRLPAFVPSSKHFVINKHKMGHLSIPEGKVFQKRYEGHWAYIVAVVLFYAIPTYQLLLTYQKYLNHTGNEDFCYYNTLCIHRLGVFSAFNNIWSNIGFFMLGLLFLIIARRKREKYRYYEDINEKFDSTDHSKHKVGVPQHFGIYYAVGVAIMGEGLMSAAYHICPTSSNYQFDTTMMFVLVTLGLYKLYECRNPDKYGRPHKLLLVLALTILFIGMGVLYSEYTVFYVFFFVIFETAAIYTSLQHYYRWIKVWPFSQLKEVLLELFCNIVYRPLPIQHKWKFCYTMLTIAMNVIWGIIMLYVRPIDFASWFLFVMIFNLMTSLIYYVASKFRYEICQKQNLDELCKLFKYEGCKNRRLLKVFQPVFYLSVAIVMWSTGLYFYSSGLTNWLESPSRSRNLNQECIFIDFFDIHDLWHFMSAFALFFSFLLLMTLDDSQEGTNRNKLHIF